MNSLSLWIVVWGMLDSFFPTIPFLFGGAVVRDAISNLNDFHSYACGTPRALQVRPGSKRYRWPSWWLSEFRTVCFVVLYNPILCCLAIRHQCPDNF